MTKASLALQHRATSGAFETNFGCEKQGVERWRACGALQSVRTVNLRRPVVTLIHRGNPTIVNVTSAGFYFMALGSSLI